MMCPIGLNSVPTACHGLNMCPMLNSVPPGDVPHRMMCPIGLNSVPPGEG